jgi:Galactosyltransferase
MLQVTLRRACFRRMAASHELRCLFIIALIAVFAPFRMLTKIIADSEGITFSSVHSAILSRDKNAPFSNDCKLTFEKKEKVDLFVIIGSGSRAKNAKLRQAMRITFLKDLVENQRYRVKYRFFVDVNASTAIEVDSGGSNDVVEMDVPTGYAHFAERAFWQLGYAHKNYDFQYLLRIDDDGYLCTYQLLYELQNNAPKEKFFWGKYFCQQQRQLADENFMLFSSDVTALFVTMKGLIRIGSNHSTFAALFGFWQFFLDLEIWDDQDRIDAQQHYTTSFMHSRKEIIGTTNEIVDFCRRHVWAHHVKNPDLIHKVHSLLPDISSREVEHARQNLVAGHICKGKEEHGPLLNPERTSLKGSGFPTLLKTNVTLL